MNLGEIDLRSLYRTCKSDLGPFQCFFRSSPFVSLQTYDDFELEESTYEYNENILNEVIKSCNENNFIIIDLPFKDILNLALVLNNEYFIKPILNINFLFHPFGIMGSRRDINQLINNGLKLKKIKPQSFVMLIPYDRYDNNLKAEDLKDNLNNQYGIGEEDIPCARMLKEMGYDKVTIFTKEKIKEDLMECVNFMKNEISVEMIRVIE